MARQQSAATTGQLDREERLEQPHLHVLHRGAAGDQHEVRRAAGSALGAGGWAAALAGWAPPLHVVESASTADALSVLVIDDDLGMRGMTAEFFGRYDIRVRTGVGLEDVARHLLANAGAVRS